MLKDDKIDVYKDDLQNSMTHNVENAINIINRKYLEDLQSLDVAPLHNAIDIKSCGKFYKLSKLVLNKDESFLDKLVTISNVAYSVGGTLTTIINSDGNKIDYYIGIVCKNNSGSNDKDDSIRVSSYNAFSGAIDGNFTGSKITAINGNEVYDLQNMICNSNINSISSVSGIVSIRDKEKNSIAQYVQGIENLTNSLNGKKYSVVMIADPIKSSEIETIKQGYEMIHTELSPFLRNVITMNETESLSLSKSKMEGITNGVTEGISKIQTSSISSATSMGISKSISIAPLGLGISVGASSSNTQGESYGNSTGTSTAKSTQTTKQTSSSSSTGTSSGKSLQIVNENRVVKGLLEKIDMYIKRFDMCQSFGAFNCASYILCENAQDGLSVASNYNALMRGEDSFVQSSYINTWNKSMEDSISKFNSIGKYIKSLMHPQFYLDKYKQILVNPSSVISGKEIAIQFGLPKKSINGVTVIDMIPFGTNVYKKDGANIEIGNLYHMGKKEATRVSLDIQSLTSHTFIAGSTGTGKSNAIYQMLYKLKRNKVKFMVIEPTKGEYKHIFGNNIDVKVFGTNNKITEMLKINPFRFTGSVHILEHIDRLIEIFNVCWAMYGAMPAILKEAIELSYTSCGWDLLSSENRIGSELYPTFADVLISLNNVIESSQYSNEMKSNYKGALLSRVKSLTNGLNGSIFSNKEIDNKILFDENVIIDLSRVSSGETKSLIMGILVMRLSEHRISQGGMNSDIKHITVLEEAHNILKRTSSEQNMESSNIIGKSVEMLSNCIAEMRTYGEGFIIADQSPSMVDLSAIRNTNTKIIFRIPDYEDRALVGKSSVMSDAQIDEVARLEKGVCAIYQNDWIEPLLCYIDYNDFNDSFEYKYKHSFENNEKIVKSNLIKLLMKNRVRENVDIDIISLKNSLKKSNLATIYTINILNIIDEYEKNGHINICEEEKFPILSNLIIQMLDENDLIDKAFRTVYSIDNLTNEINEIVDSKGLELSNEISAEVSHCIFKYMSSKSEENLKLYYLWDKQIR